MADNDVHGGSLDGWEDELQDWDDAVAEQRRHERESAVHNVYKLAAAQEAATWPGTHADFAAARIQMLLVDPGFRAAVDAAVAHERKRIVAALRARATRLSVRTSARTQVIAVADDIEDGSL